MLWIGQKHGWSLSEHDGGCCCGDIFQVQYGLHRDSGQLEPDPGPADGIVAKLRNGHPSDNSNEHWWDQEWEGINAGSNSPDRGLGVEGWSST